MEKESPKLLVVVGTELPDKLGEYALKMAERLDLEIIVLFVDEENTWENKKQHRREVERFESRIEGAAAEFSTLAWKSAVSVTTVVDVNSKDSAVSQIQEQEPGIRFILTDSQDDSPQPDGDNQVPKLTVIHPV